MAESRLGSESIGDLEALVRSAGQYVRASDDLRPRVLELACAQSREQRARRRVRHLAVFVVLLASFTTAGRHHLFGDEPTGGRSLFSAELDASLTRAVMGASGDRHSSWSAVEAFTNLRQRQAKALRLTM